MGRNQKTVFLVIGVGIFLALAVVFVPKFRQVTEPVVPVQPPEEVSEPIAIVNGEKILKKDWERRVETQRYFYTVLASPPEANTLENLEQESLEFLIRLTLLEQFLEQRGRTVTDDEVLSYIEDSTKEAYPDFAAYKAVLANSYRMTLDDVKLNFKEELLVKRVVGSVPEKRLLAIWLSRKESREGTDDIAEGWGVIEDKLPETERPVYELAKSLLSRAQAGEDFSLLAREFSEHAPTAENGGDLGFISEDYNPLLSQLSSGEVGVSGEHFPVPALMLYAFEHLSKNETALYNYPMGFAIMKAVEVRGGEESLIADREFDAWYNELRKAADVKILTALREQP